MKAKSNRKGRIPQTQIVQEWEDLVILENPDRPGVYDMRMKRDIGKLSKGKLHSRTNHEGWLFWCKGCNVEHLITWNTCSYTNYLMETRGISILLLLCIDGAIHFWQSGTPYPDGTHKTLLAHWELR